MIKHLPSSPEDGLLLLEIKAGSAAAFNLLYNKYWASTYAAAYKRLLDPDQSKDIVQDIFTYVWINRENLIIENVPAYFSVAVRNRVFKLAAKQKNQSPFLSILENIPEKNIDSDKNMLWKEVLLAYENLLNTLPEQRRKIFRMRFDNDLPTNRIAEQLGLSRKTVQNQIRLAVEQIKHTLLHLMSALTMLLFL